MVQLLLDRAADKRRCPILEVAVVFLLMVTPAWAAQKNKKVDKKASVQVPDPKGKDGMDKVAINIGISNGAKTEVLSGLKEGDQVVLQ